MGDCLEMASGNQLFTEDGILPGLGKKTQKAREDAFLKLLQHFEKKDSEKIMLEGFFDLMDEHGVYVADQEVDELCALADENGDIDHTQLFDYARNSKFWEILIKKDVYANEEVLKLMTKTYDLSGRAKDRLKFPSLIQSTKPSIK
eukprot:TRINITY_DN16766_c0_g1_i1.p1 TRINITY_DN16766_c0_g1~~TRINITY_DN16766_c0_g1_i1.p1  ORF type:complete len:154 (-),score=59.20 TRINITY_DN16766_c0_g1_i1:87-524(-)